MKNKNIKSLIKSFSFAFRGLAYCIKNERNMRIHFTVSILVIIFSLIYGLSAIQYIALLLAIGFVYVSEMINTSIEVLVDLQTSTYAELARICKDVAAGGVLVSAIVSVLVGFLLFFSDVDRLIVTICHIATSYIYLPLFIIILILGIFFIFHGFEKPNIKK